MLDVPITVVAVPQYGKWQEANLSATDVNSRNAVTNFGEAGRQAAGGPAGRAPGRVRPRSDRGCR